MGSKEKRGIRKTDVKRSINEKKDKKNQRNMRREIQGKKEGIIEEEEETKETKEGKYVIEEWEANKKKRIKKKI